MASNPLPTLSRKGWLDGVAERADRQLAYYLASNASQTMLYRGNVRSLQATVQAYNNDATRLKSAVESDLTALYLAVFDAVSVNVTVTDTATDGSYRYNIAMDVVLTEAGQNYQLGNVIQTINGVVQPLLSSINGT